MAGLVSSVHAKWRLWSSRLINTQGWKKKKTYINTFYIYKHTSTQSDRIKGLPQVPRIRSTGIWTHDLLNSWILACSLSYVFLRSNKSKAFKPPIIEVEISYCQQPMRAMLSHRSWTIYHTIGHPSLLNILSSLFISQVKTLLLWFHPE